MDIKTSNLPFINRIIVLILGYFSFPIKCIKDKYICVKLSGVPKHNSSKIEIFHCGLINTFNVIISLKFWRQEVFPFAESIPGF